MTTCRYTFAPVMRRIAVTSTCHYSLGCVARTPIFGFAGYTPARGRFQPRSRTSLLQIEAQAKTSPMRWAYHAKMSSGICRCRLLVTVSLMVEISSGVGCDAEFHGQLERSSRLYSGSARLHL